MTLNSYWIRWISLIPFFSLAWTALDWGTQFRSQYSRLSLAAALGSAYLVLATAVLTRWTHAVPSALWIGSGISALLTLPLLFRHCKGPKGSWRIPFTWLGGLTFAASFLISVTVAIVAIRFSFHDQISVQAHPPLIESMLRGNLPPHLLVFPDIPLKYHYGSDLFGAILSYVTGLPAYHAIDVTQIFGWIVTMACLYLLCQELELGAGHSLAALLWVLLASGWPYLLRRWLLSPQDLTHVPLDWPVSYAFFYRHLNPGTANNFFMTPYSLGMPLFFAYLTLFFQFLREKGWKLVIFLTLLLAALANIQVTFYLSLLSTSLFVLFLEFLLKRRNWREFLYPALALSLVSLAFGKIMGGFFLNSIFYSRDLLVFNGHPGYLRNSLFGVGRPPLTFHQALLWYLSTLGSLVFLTLPCLILALLALRKKFDPRLLFLLFYAVLCFAMTQFFSYKLSWDIIKWFTGFHMAMLLVVVFLWSRLKTKKLLVGWMLGLCLVLDLIPTLRFLPSLAYLQPDQVNPINRVWWRSMIPPPSEDLLPILRALRTTSWKEVILTSLESGIIFGRYTGQASAVADANTQMFGVKPEILAARAQLNLALQKSFDVSKMSASPIRWIVYPCGDFEKVFSEESKSALQSAVQSGALADLSYTSMGKCWKVYHLQGPS